MSKAAVDLLAEASGLSRRAIKTAMTKGAVWKTRRASTQRLRRAKTELWAGDTLHLYYDPRILAQEPPPARLVADEGAYSVWWKPCGMFAQGSKWGDHCTLERWSARHLVPQRPVFTVHRLDRATRGLMLIAHTKTAAGAFSRMFRERAIEKRYRAGVHGAFPETLTVDAPIDEREAISHATLIDYDPARDRSTVEVRIETGRKHQIRRHLAQAGFPVVGDRLHGRGGVGDEDLDLEAIVLAFTCPVSETPKRYGSSD